MHLTAAMLGQAKPGQVRSVPVPEFGPGVNAFVGQMGAIERDERIEVAWIEYCDEAGKTGNARAIGFTAWAVAASLCDAERRWLAADPAQIAPLAEKLGTDAANVVSRLFVEVAPLQGLTKEDVAELQKKLNKTPSAAPSSGSPTASAASPNESSSPG